MKYIRLKIRDHFISLIRNGYKTHEYRLAEPKYADIHVGDVLILISNQSPNNFVKVIIDSIVNFSNWDEALKGRWENDFKGIYQKYDDVLKECYRFYNREDIEKYGINVYKTRLYKKSLNNARYLLDTNIIIERESSNDVLQEVMLTYAAIDKQKGTKFIHELTIDEIRKYNDEKSRNNILTKLNAYPKLYSSQESSNEFERVCLSFSNDSNSKNDNELLRQVYNGNVDFLITQDQTIIKKANLLYLHDSVFTPNTYLRIVEEENPKLIDYNVLSVKLVPIVTLDINDTFFDSLREDYGGSKFNDWLRSKSNDNAYVFMDKSELLAFLYLKIEGQDEDYSFFNPSFKPAKRLKVGTFKVSLKGLRLGERFLKIIFDNATKNGVDEVYLTLFKDKRQEVMHLKALMEEWGFIQKTIDVRTGEIVLVKDMKKYDYSKSPKFNYPILTKDKKIMFLPILAKYHSKLFPDLKLKNENIDLYNEEPCCYATEKIYVCGWTNIIAQPGDLVIVYRMGENYKKYTSVVSGIGILMEIKYPENEFDFKKECGNKTVFTDKELSNFYWTNHWRTIVKVLFLEGFTNKINLKKLWDNGIISSNGKGPRINTFISEESFKNLKKLGEE